MSMVKPIVRDVFFLGRKSEPATRADLQDSPYEAEEGCLSLDGVRRVVRYRNIEVEYFDMNWKKKRRKLSGWTAQICQHEIQHCRGEII